MRELSVPARGGVTAAILPALAADPHRPRLVSYGAAGRTELSGATLTNWAAKTAGFLVDELGAVPGDLALWRVARSWQGLPLLLGAWWAGLVVTDRPDLAGDAVVAFVDPPADALPDSTPDGFDPEDLETDEILVASEHPFGLAVPGLPPLLRNVGDAVLPHADRFTPRLPGPGADAPAVRTPAAERTVGQLLDAVARAATALPEGAVLLTTGPPDLSGSVIDGPLAVWSAGGTIVFAGPDPAGCTRTAADERVTGTLGLDVPGLPRIG